MTHVVFALGRNPALTERQALNIAEALGRRRNRAAQRGWAKIRVQARVNVDAGEQRADVELEPEELEELAAVLNEKAWPDDEPEHEHLRRELLLHLG